MPNQRPSPSPLKERDPTVAIVMTVLSAGIVTGLSLFLLGGLIGRFLPHSAEERCSEDNPCPPDKQCSMGECIVPVGPQVCDDDDRDPDCYCPLPRARDNPDKLCQSKPVQPAACDGELFMLLLELRETQKTCAQTVAGGPTSCHPEDIRKFMLKHKQFDRILNKAPSTSWLLFPPGKPSINGNWPPPVAYATYLKNLSYGMASFKEASHILVLSHATQDNNPTNNALLQERLKLAYRLLQDLDKDDPSWRSAVQAKLMGFSIPPDQPVVVENLRSTDPNVKLPDVNIVASNSSDLSRFSNAFDILRGRTSGSLKQHEYDDLEKTLNRSVTIVPIFCQLPVEKPQATPAP